FFDEHYALAPSGHISPISALDALLSADTRAALEGDTASERYVRVIRQCIEARGDEVDGASVALAPMIKHFPRASRDALLPAPTPMFAIHINSKAVSPLRALREMFDDEGEIPDRHTTEYFAMDYRVTDNGIEVVSSGLDQPGWSRVPADTAVA